jgi:hypothetical protein
VRARAVPLHPCVRAVERRLLAPANLPSSLGCGLPKPRAPVWLPLPCLPRAPGFPRHAVGCSRGAILPVGSDPRAQAARPRPIAPEHHSPATGPQGSCSTWPLERDAERDAEPWGRDQPARRGHRGAPTCSAQPRDVPIGPTGEGISLRFQLLFATESLNIRTTGLLAAGTRAFLAIFADQPVVRHGA